MPSARSWEALEGELAAIGVHPQCWPLPLTLAAVREAEKNPIAQPIPQLPAIKRGTGEGEPAVSSARWGPGHSWGLERRVGGWQVGGMRLASRQFKKGRRLLCLVFVAELSKSRLIHQPIEPPAAAACCTPVWRPAILPAPSLTRPAPPPPLAPPACPRPLSPQQGRGRRGGPTVDLERLTEYELWKHLLDVLNVCTNKNNTCELWVAARPWDNKNT